VAIVPLYRDEKILWTGLGEDIFKIPFSKSFRDFPGHFTPGIIFLFIHLPDLIFIYAEPE
jgi:hypothetical protein